MNYSQEDMERVARIAGEHAVLYGPKGITLGDLPQYLDWLAHYAINRFWDEEVVVDVPDTVPVMLNGREVQVTPGEELTFQQIADLAGVPNADTCVFRRKRANALVGTVPLNGTLKMQGGMRINIVNTGRA